MYHVYISNIALLPCNWGFLWDYLSAPLVYEFLKVRNLIHINCCAHSSLHMVHSL